MDKEISESVLKEASLLAKEILGDLESSDHLLSDCALKTCRLAYLINDTEFQTILEFEIKGYPEAYEKTGIEIDNYLKKAGRIELLSKKWGYSISIMGIMEAENNIKIYKAAVSSTTDPDMSISFTKSIPIIFKFLGNKKERNRLLLKVTYSVKVLACSRVFIYKYVLQKLETLTNQQL